MRPITALESTASTTMQVPSAATMRSNPPTIPKFSSPKTRIIVIRVDTMCLGPIFERKPEGALGVVLMRGSRSEL